MGQSSGSGLIAEDETRDGGATIGLGKFQIAARNISFPIPRLLSKYRTVRLRYGT